MQGDPIGALEQFLAVLKADRNWADSTTKCIAFEGDIEHVLGCAIA